MKRKDILEKYKWDLSDIYKSRKDEENDLKRFNSLIEKISKFKGKLLNDSKTLKEFFDLTREIQAILDRSEAYNSASLNIELDNSEASEGLDRVENLINQYNEAISFVCPEILSSDFATISKLIENDDDLKKLDKYFNDLFRSKEHLLSENEEKILSGFQLVLEGYRKSNTYMIDKEIDYGSIEVDGEEVLITASNIPKYLSDKDRSVRKRVFELEGKAVSKHVDSLATNLISFIKGLECEAKYRHFKNGLEKRFFDDDLDLKVYETLIKSVPLYKDFYKKYVQLFTHELGYEELYVYDLNAPLFENSTKKYTVEEAKDIILNTFSILGDEYLDVLKLAFEKKCIDYYPADNKSTGWYCMYSSCTIPKVFANFEGRILDISSLSHELGHFCNQYLSMKENIPEYCYHSVFCAEVASLTNEILFSYLYQTEDKETKLQLLFNFVKTFAANFFGSARQALFEESIHELAGAGEPLGSEILNNLWLETAKNVFGEEVKGFSAYSWSFISHFFLSGGFYVYNYSTAIIAATNVASKILNKEEGILKKYMEFLKVGSKMRPQECLSIIGIDMCDTKTYDNAIKFFSDAIDELKKIKEER